MLRRALKLVCALMRRRLLSPLGLALACALAACGKSTPQQGSGTGPGSATAAIAQVTKNTTRLGGANAAADAAAVAVAVYPGLTVASRPPAVVLVDASDWTAAIVASELAAAPLGAPILYTQGGQLPPSSARALATMRPSGAPALGGAQVIRVAGAASPPSRYSSTAISGTGAAQLAAGLARLDAQAQGRRPAQVIVLAEGAEPALQMPAAGLAAESGAPILLVGDESVPPATASALAAMSHPAIYVLGAPAIGPRAVALLGRYGRVTRIPAGEGAGAASGGAEAADPVANAIAVSRFSDRAFGWGVREAGHGLAFADATRPLDAPAAAPLSSHGDYAPLLLLSGADSLPGALERYLSDIQPGYTASVPPVREVYNHGWLIGDESAISARVQAEIDAILEVAPRAGAPAPATPPE
jgi:hypothetical protein